MRLIVGLLCLACFSVSASILATARFSSSMMKPWGYQDLDSSQPGLLVDFVRQLADEAGIQVVNQLRPYPRVIKDMQAGNADFAVMFAGPLSDEVAIDLGFVLELKIMAVAKAGAPAIASVNALLGKRVGVIRGSIYGPQIDDNPDIQRISFNDTAQGIQMLLLGRLDVMIATNYSIDYALKELHANVALLTPVYQLASQQGHLYWSRASAQSEQAERLRAALQRLHQRGIVDNIFQIDASLALQH